MKNNLQEGTFLKPAIHDETGTCKMASEILSSVGDKWSILVVVCLSEKAHRFNELKRFIGNISQKMLTQTLRNLERNGFVDREVTPTRPPQVSYSLTVLGEEFQDVAVNLAKWAAQHSDVIHKVRQEFDKRNNQ